MRIVIGIAGAVMLALGIAGLANPHGVMEFVGYCTTPTTALILGEVRGIYGGLFAVMGVFTLIAATNPTANRGALLLVGLLWLGVGGGRLTGVYFDGDPGLPGWIAAAFELTFGVVLSVISMLSRPRPKVENKRTGPTFPLPAGPTEL